MCAAQDSLAPLRAGGGVRDSPLLLAGARERGVVPLGRAAAGWKINPSSKMGAVRAPWRAAPGGLSPNSFAGRR